MRTPQSVLVFGGSGFIGSHLVEKLVSDGTERIVIADLKPPHREWGPTVEFVSCDIRKPIDLAFEGDLVVNLAAIAKEPGYERQEYFDTNEHGAANVLEFMRKRRLNRLWFTSSMSTYGPSEEPCSEDSLQKPNTAYGESKLNAEKLHFDWLSENPERKLVMSRPAVIFGPREGGNFTRLARSLKKGYFFYPGRRDTIKANGYVADLIESLFFMDAQPDQQLLFNFCYPQTYAIEQIVNSFIKVGGFAKAKGTVPKGVVLLAAKMMQVANRSGLKGDIHPMRVYKLIRSTNIVPTELEKRGFAWPTGDLLGGLKAWHQADPKGQFV